MKNIKITLVAVVAALSFACAVQAHEQDIPLITVTGTAKVQVAPDSGEFVFGVETRAVSLTEARSDNEQRTKAIIEALKKVGVGAKDLRTDEIEVQPYFGENDSRTKPVHFSVSRSISVKIRDVSQFESSLTAALKAGATHVRKAELQSTELRRHKDEARILAARAAREKAGLLAKELGVSVGKAFSIREASTEGYNVSNARNVAQNYAPSGSTDSTSLAAGLIEISISVDVSFRIE